MPLTRKLGIYLLVAGLSQIVWLGIGAKVTVPTPRFGLVAFLPFPGTSTEAAVVYYLPQLLSALWTVSLGVLFTNGKRPLKAYLTSEVFLTGPSILYALAMISTYGLGGMGLSAVGVNMVLVIVTFDLVPCWMAILALTRGD